MKQWLTLLYGLLGLLLCGETLFARELTLTGSKLSEEKSITVLHVDIKNTGSRSLFPVVWADLYNQENRYVGRFRSVRTKIAPGASHLFSIAFDTLQAGTYSALVVGHYLSNDPSEDISDTVSLLGNIKSFNLPIKGDDKNNIIKNLTSHPSAPVPRKTSFVLQVKESFYLQNAFEFVFLQHGNSTQPK